MARARTISATDAAAFITWEAGKLAEAGLPMRKFPQHTIRFTHGSRRLYELTVNADLAIEPSDRAFAWHTAAAVWPCGGSKHPEAGRPGPPTPHLWTGGGNDGAAA